LLLSMMCRDPTAAQFLPGDHTDSMEERIARSLQLFRMNMHSMTRGDDAVILAESTCDFYGVENHFIIHSAHNNTNNTLIDPHVHWASIHMKILLEY
jgi:hypothetical protein